MLRASVEGVPASPPRYRPAGSISSLRSHLTWCQRVPMGPMQALEAEMSDLMLVTGASGGQQGKTGRHIAELLLACGIPVRAFVHRLDQRSDALRALGAEIFEADLRDVQAVRM